MIFHLILCTDNLTADFDSLQFSIYEQYFFQQGSEWKTLVFELVNQSFVQVNVL